ncbi:hypothetical protein SD340_001120 [Vibrio fluvialis]|nr:hypothetical protein [Vibrio sp. LQ2]EKO3452648.1 hypothetical protein [Vibrio fluvialis]ELC0658523.1 hypothetical protein [Vibrio fluvialis]ELL4666668.1 hypothetical protein [Vibrio fluvialis]ELU8399305.1 hypothetical protein [Vibrio fluvialis]MBY7942600.1 hypothetical protein [Vibrio fluvialis]
METVIVAVVTGAISSVATIVALKVDISWIKNTLSDHEKRLRALEAK